MNSKGMMINSIINHLQEHNTKKNQELMKDNLYWKQEAFDAGDMFFKLAFMPDDKVNHIAKLILG